MRFIENRDGNGSVYYLSSSKNKTNNNPLKSIIFEFLFCFYFVGVNSKFTYKYFPVVTVSCYMKHK